MVDQKITTTEEMYLITIYRMRSGNPKEPVSISELAEKLNVQPVSANQMIRKMADEGLVEYLPYKGVLLLNSGEQHTLRVLRMRRLWEVFLVRELEIPLDEAEVLACDLEHHISGRVSERLDAFLGHPKFCYHGEPIPDDTLERGEFFVKRLLTDLAVGESAPVIKINADEATQRFLKNAGIKPGVHIKLTAVGNHAHYLVEVCGKRIYLSEEVASVMILGMEI